MSRPRTPVIKATVSGAAIKNPKRHRNRVEPALMGLGNAPDWFDHTKAIAWDAFRRELAWLTEADRALLEIAAPIRAALMSGDEVGFARLNLYRLCLAQLGASPADRSKISVPESDERDEDDEFYNHKSRT